MWNWKILAAKYYKYFNLHLTPHFANTMLCGVIIFPFSVSFLVFCISCKLNNFL